METEKASSVSAVQCSVIQYCSDVAQSSQVPENGETSESAENSSKTPPETTEEEVIILDSPKSFENNSDFKNEIKKEEMEEIIIIEDRKPGINNSLLAVVKDKLESEKLVQSDIKEIMQESNVKEKVKNESIVKEEIKEEILNENEADIEEVEGKKKGKMKKTATVMNGDADDTLPADTSSLDPMDDDGGLDSESDDEIESKPKRRGRCKKNPELIPSHLAPDIALGYRMLLKFLETPQFAVFQRQGQLNLPIGEELKPDQIICLNQIKKKFDENVYGRLADFINDVRSMLTTVYQAPRNSVAVKRALRLEQVLEQRIAQLPNYLRPQCSLILTADETTSNSPQKIRINKGGGFVSLLLERAEKVKAEKDREKRKVLAEERKQMKEEQDKDVQDWEKNILLKEHEDEIKSMWELPQIGHFIHICANILNIGDVSQYEVERMLLMPQCSDTLDLLITALLSNSLTRAKLDRTPSMPYSIWSPLVRTRVNSWYRAMQREFGNRQKVFEEIGVEPEFWDAVGSEHCPLDHFYFHEIPLFQRVWILKTLCDVDFVRKKTVHDNIRQQLLEELSGTYLGIDRHGNRYIHFPQFGMTALRIYKQAPYLDEELTPADLIESTEGFEERRGEITIDKVFRDIWDVGTKAEQPKKKVRGRRKKKKDASVVIKIDPTPSKSLRQSARAKRKVYIDSTDSDGSDTDLATLRNKLADKETQNKSISEKTYISLSVFRLPRDKVKPTNKKSYYSRKLEREEMERLKAEERESKDSKLSGFDEDASLDLKLEDDDDDDGKENFTVKNLENLKMVLKKGNEDADNPNDVSANEEDKFRYTTPAHLLPDKNKFYLVVDSVEGLRQLISQFASDDNDLEIVNRSRSGRKSSNKGPPSCEVLLIERLQKLLEELESWEMDFVKTSRSIREKLHREYTNFVNRPDDFVHPNEAYWLKLYEEPPPPPPPPPPEPDIPVVEPTPLAVDSSILNPPSPLGGLRPRTRTRQQQLLHKMEAEIDEDLDDEFFESSESDDNWELPSKKRKKSSIESVRATPKSVRQSKRQAKRRERATSPASGDSDKGPDKAKRALFWSPRSSDPSEDLNWEKNRQKILEKHNSPRKGCGDGDKELEIISPLRAKLCEGRVIPPPPIPGNKKPYFSAAQLKKMEKSKDNDVHFIASMPHQETQIQPKSSKRPRPTARPVLKKSASTQSNDFIDLESNSDLHQPPPQRIIQQQPQVQMLNQQQPQLQIQSEQQHEFYLTDGNVLFKVDAKFVQDMMKNNQLLSLHFKDKLDLTKPVHIVKKRADGIPPPIVANTTAVQTAEQPVSSNMQQTLQHAPSAPTMMVAAKTTEPSVIKVVSSSSSSSGQSLASEGTKVGTGLRFIRPQNVAQNQMTFMKPTQATGPRPVTRLPTPPQPSIVYLQASQPQGLIQIPAGVRPPGIVQVVAQRPLESASSTTVAVHNQVRPAEAEQVTLLSSASTPAQFGYIQMQAASKQPAQLVQISQANPQVSSSVQSSSPAIVASNNQNVVRLVQTTSGQAPSYVRLTPAGSQISFVQVASGQGPSYPQQVSVVSSVGTSTVVTGTHSQANSVSLVQVQGLPGDGINYVQLAPSGKIVQLQQTPQKTQPTLVQLSSSSPRQQAPVGRIMQMQAPQQQTVSVQQPSPVQARPQMVQMVAPRPQTTVYQVYGSPRMVQMQGNARPAATQVQRPPTGLVQVQAPLQANLRPQVMTDQQRPQSIGVLQGSIRQQMSSSPTPRLPVQGTMRPQGTLVQVQSVIDGGQSGTRPQQGGLMAVQSNVGQVPGTARPQGTVVAVQSSMPQTQANLRPQNSQVLQTRPNVVQAQVQTRPQGTLLRVQTPPRQMNPGQVARVQAPTSVVATPVSMTAMPSMVQVQSSAGVQASGTVPKVVSQLVQACSSNPKSMGIQMMQVQPGGTLKPIGTQVLSSQSGASTPVAAQIVQVPAGTAMGSQARPLTTHVVQMPMAGGKTGYFQIESASGQPMTIVQVVTSAQPTTTTTSTVKNTLPNVVHLQGANMTQNFIQVASSNKQPVNQLQNATGLPQNSLAGQVVMAAPSLVSRPRQQQVRPTTVSSQPSPNRTQGSSLRFVTSSARQTVRFVGADGKPVQAVALQPSLVRSPASRVSMQQPIIFGIEDDDDEGKIIGGNSMTVNSDSVDILSGELSTMETASGWRYSVKTTNGEDYILNNDEVERRRAANNGRMV